MYTIVKNIGHHGRLKKTSISFAIEFSLREIFSQCKCTRSFACDNDAKIGRSRDAQTTLIWSSIGQIARITLF